MFCSTSRHFFGGRDRSDDERTTKQDGSDKDSVLQPQQRGRRVEGEGQEEQEEQEEQGGIQQPR